jgi:hypothetical protein
VLINSAKNTENKKLLILDAVYSSNVFFLINKLFQLVTKVRLTRVDDGGVAIFAKDFSGEKSAKITRPLIPSAAAI